MESAASARATWMQRQAAEEKERASQSHARHAAGMRARDEKVVEMKQQRVEEEARREREWEAAKHRTKVQTAERDAAEMAVRAKIEAAERERDTWERADAAQRAAAAQERAQAREREEKERQQADTMDLRRLEQRNDGFTPSGGFQMTPSSRPYENGHAVRLDDEFREQKLYNEPDYGRPPYETGHDSFGDSYQLSRVTPSRFADEPAFDAYGPPSYAPPLHPEPIHPEDLVGAPNGPYSLGPPSGGFYAMPPPPPFHKVGLDLNPAIFDKLFESAWFRFPITCIESCLSMGGSHGMGAGVGGVAGNPFMNGGRRGFRRVGDYWDELDERAREFDEREARIFELNRRLMRTGM